MHQSKPKGLTVRALPILAVLALLTALALAPAFFRSEAQSRKGKGLVARTGSHAAGIPNYDIRLDKKSVLKRGEMRRRDGLGADVAADVRDGAVAGEEKLRSSHPQLKIEYAPETD